MSVLKIEWYGNDRQSFGAGNLASMYYEQGQLDLAIFHYKQAISCDSAFLEAYNNLVGQYTLCCTIIWVLIWKFDVPVN